jgi:hypothetical protein
LVNKETVVKQVPDQFFKSLNKLEISIKSKNININFENDKQLIGNNYKNIEINETSTINYYKLLLISKIKHFFINMWKIFI